MRNAKVNQWKIVLGLQFCTRRELYEPSGGEIDDECGGFAGGGEDWERCGNEKC